MTKYVLVWKILEFTDGTSGDNVGKTSRNSYTSLDKARAAAYRMVNSYSVIGRFAAVSVKEVVGDKQKLVGDVVFDSNYAYNGWTGIFWIPVRCWRESYHAQGVSSSGKLKDQYYRLT